ncbi:MAG TPA: bifunctional riboflavin kinase/FAD synthetase [Beijerinckiaceae bacterium]|jgi:riboflavin kinase/FMN adenylyltransferase
MPPDPLDASAFAVRRDGDDPGPLAGAIVAIGNFDGVHRGHKALLAAAGQAARTAGRPAAVLTFEPHPRSYFRPNVPLFRLTPEAEKLLALERLGLDGAFVRRFDAGLAGLTAEAFVDQLLVTGMQASGVVVGHDFRFGRDRAGTVERLADLCAARGLSCAVLPAVLDGAEPVSSSRIRAALTAGDVAEANGLLGHRWFVTGEVRHGDKRGRTLGYPTANQRLPETCDLRHGIYAVRVRLADGSLRAGVASFGRRPTFDDGAPRLETFLFDFAGDLYGQDLAVEFAAFIRGEERFDSAEALIARMDEDSRQAREILAGDNAPSLLAS